MRTTLELPDELLRQAKARAALRGMKLKEFVAEALERALYYPSDVNSGSRVAEGTGADELVLSEDCVFPLIRGEGGPAVRDTSGQKVKEALEDEDVERALGSRRR